MYFFVTVFSNVCFKRRYKISVALQINSISLRKLKPEEHKKWGTSYITYNFIYACSAFSNSILRTKETQYSSGQY